MGGKSRGEGIYAYIWLIHFTVQQKLAQHWEATIPQGLARGDCSVGNSSVIKGMYKSNVTDTERYLWQSIELKEQFINFTFLFLSAFCLFTHGIYRWKVWRNTYQIVIIHVFCSGRWNGGPGTLIPSIYTRVCVIASLPLILLYLKIHLYYCLDSWLLRSSLYAWLEKVMQETGVWSLGREDTSGMSKVK